MRNLDAWQLELRAHGFKPVDMVNEDANKLKYRILEYQLNGIVEKYQLNEFVVTFGAGFMNSTGQQRMTFNVWDGALYTLYHRQSDRPKVTPSSFRGFKGHLGNIVFGIEDIEAEDQVLSVIEAITDPSLAPTLIGIEWAIPITERLLKWLHPNS